VFSHRRRLSVWGSGAKFGWTHKRRKGSVVGGTVASAEHEPIMGVWGQSPCSGGAKPPPPEAESILVIGCPTEPANLAPLVIFSKCDYWTIITELNSHLKKSEHSHERYRGKTQRLPRFLREYRGVVPGCPGGVGAYVFSALFVHSELKSASRISSGIYF